MKNILALAIVMTVTIWGLGGCEKSPDSELAPAPETTASAETKTKAPAQEATDQEILDTTTVIAQVNGIPIFAHALDTQLVMSEAGESVFKDKSAESQSNREQDDMALKIDVLNSLIALELVAQEALDRGYTPTEDELDAELKKSMEDIKSDSEDQPYAPLDYLNPNEEEMRKQLIKTLALQKWYKYEFLSQMAVPGKEARALYDQNPELARHGDIIRARQIFIGVPLIGISPAIRVKARKQAEIVLLRLKSGESFVTVAKDTSNDPDVDQTGGDLGWMPKDHYLPFIGQALQKLKPGELSEIVDTPLGFYIYQMVDTKPAGIEPFEGVRAQLVDYLSNQKLGQAVSRKVQQLYKQAEIEIYDPVLKRAVEKQRLASQPPAP